MKNDLPTAIAILCGTMVIIGTMDAVSKLLVADLHVGQILAVRYWMLSLIHI